MWKKTWIFNWNFYKSSTRAVSLHWYDSSLPLEGSTFSSFVHLVASLSQFQWHQTAHLGWDDWGLTGVTVRRSFHLVHLLLLTPLPLRVSFHVWVAGKYLNSVFALMQWATKTLPARSEMGNGAVRTSGLISPFLMMMTIASPVLSPSTNVNYVYTGFTLCK